MTITPTSPERRLRHADFATLTEALDYAAQGETGINLYDLRGQLALALPYRQLREEALALGRALLAAGLKSGDRVGLVADTTPEFIRAFFACQYAGIAPTPLPLPAPLGGRAAYVDQIGRMLSSAQAAAVFGPAAYDEWVQEAGQQAGVRFHFTLAGLPDGGRHPLPRIAPDQTSYLQFSSGSTRQPTGVVVTHRALMANAAAITRHGLQVRAADRAVSWLPLYHDMGLSGFLLTPLASQMSVDLLPTAAFVRRPLLWLELLSRNRGTVSYSPTFGYDLCARRGDSGAFDLSSWRIAGVGGDMVRAAPLDSFAESFAAAGFKRTAFVASYGMAEATLALSMAPLHEGLRTETVDIDRLERDGAVRPPTEAARQRRFVRCGPVLPGHELQVRDDANHVLGERQVGSIFVRGPSLMREYFHQPDATAAVLSPDGWLDTGDLGFLAEGEVVPTGRAKDLILINGRNVWPQDLEWTAEQGVSALRTGDVAAFSVEDAGEEKVLLLVQCRSSDPHGRQAIADEVSALMRARHGLDARVRLVGPHALPRTSSGKLSRSKARALYEAGAFDAGES